MSVSALVSYDDTPNDQDALALARVFADVGADLTLAYVRHATQTERSQERLEEHEAEALLSRGARWLGDLAVERRVVVHASTGEGLRALAEEEDHELIVFGSDYRTAAGHVAPQRSAQRLLEGGPTALAIAPANYSAGWTPEIRTLGLLAGLDDSAAIDTAHQLALHFDATVTDTAHGVELLIVGSRPEAREGHVMISAQAQNAIETATAPVLIVARGVALDFRSSIYVS